MRKFSKASSVKQTKKNKQRKKKHVCIVTKKVKGLLTDILAPWEGTRGRCGEDSVARRRFVAVIITWILICVIVLE